MENKKLRTFTFRWRFRSLFAAELRLSIPKSLKNSKNPECPRCGSSDVFCYNTVGLLVCENCRFIVGNEKQGGEK